MVDAVTENAKNKGTTDSSDATKKTMLAILDLEIERLETLKRHRIYPQKACSSRESGLGRWPALAKPVAENPVFRELGTTHKRGGA
jgi:hypothetical protein